MQFKRLDFISLKMDSFDKDFFTRDILSYSKNSNKYNRIFSDNLMFSSLVKERPNPERKNRGNLQKQTFCDYSHNNVMLIKIIKK